jgi:hypothetical protein
MLTELPTQPLPVVAVLPAVPPPGPPPAPPRRRVLALTVAVLAVLVGAVATVVALVPHDPPDRVGPALDRLRAWPSTAVNGDLTGGDGPLRVHATVTADGWSAGTVGRARGAEAEFVVGPGSALVRGNVQWWRETDPLRAAAGAGRWVGGVRDGAVDQFARGRLAPAALADALAGLRDPQDRAEADVVVDGVPGRSFARGGLRLVVGPDGAPLALTALVAVPGGRTVGFRAGPAAADVAWTAALSVAPPTPADGDTVRRVAADAARSVVASPAPEPPGLDATPRRGPANQVTVDAVPLRGGCPRTGCTLRYHVANHGSDTAAGTFTVRVGDHLLAVLPLTLEPGHTADVATRVPPAVLAEHPERSLEVRATFRPDPTR